jgi:hypothetical protein
MINYLKIIMYVYLKQTTFPLFFSCTIIKNKKIYLIYLKSDKIFFFFEIEKKKARIYKDTQGIVTKSEYPQREKNINFLQFFINKLLRS